MFDEAWRQVAVFRESDTSPKEEFVPHLAGLDGMGGSSMLDAVACRYRDANSGWTSAADGTLEERKYLLQNWRGDVSVIVDSSAGVNEYAKYSAYGIPFALPAGDADSDGDCDSTDTNQIQTWINGSSYDVRGDLDLDGDVDATDKTNAVNNYSGTTLAWNVLSKSSLANRRGYAGYEKDVNLASFWHVRHRVLDSQLGRWLRRDPADYIDGQSLYAYVNLQALRYIDPQGLMTVLSGPIGSTAGTSSGGQVDCAFPMGPQGGTASGPQPGPPATSGPAQDPETRPLGDCCKSLAFPPGAFARVICCKTKPTVCMNSQAFMPLIRFPYSLPDLALYSCVRDLEDKKASMLTCTHANGTKVGDGGNPVTVDVPPPGLGPLGTEAFEAINMSKVEIESHKNLQKCLRNYKTFCGQSVECNSKFMEYITGIENWINVKKIGLEVNQGFYDGFKISGR
jgi:RHS repeat-associated protein